MDGVVVYLGEPATASGSGGGAGTADVTLAAGEERNDSVTPKSGGN